VDPFEDILSSPLSLNKYLYANADPVNRVDPAGLVSFSYVGALLDMQAILRVTSTQSFRVFLKRAVTETLLTPRAALREMQLCRRTPNKCRLTLPVHVTGNETRETARHIRDAQTWGGSAIITGPWMFILHRKPAPKDRSWLKRTLECYPEIKAAYRRLSSHHCDEYPYNSTHEGGRKRYDAGLVSLRLTPPDESSIQGNRLYPRFYNACGIQESLRPPRGETKRPRSRFLSLGVPELAHIPPLCFR
jgi:hypothetical protein